MPVVLMLVSDRMSASEFQKKILNGALFQIGWFAAVLGGNVWAVPTLLMILIAHRQWWVRSEKEWWLILAVTLLGCGLDSLWVGLGVLMPGGESLMNGQSGWLMPAWLVCIWIMFSMTLCHVFSWLHGQYALAAVLGAVAGPMSYLAGAKLSGLALGEPQWQSLFAMGVVWGLLMPILMRLAQRVYSNR